MGEQRRQAKEKTVKKGEDRKKKTARIYTLSPPPTPVHPRPHTECYMYRPQIGAKLNLAHRNTGKKENRSSYTESYSDLGLGLSAQCLAKENKATVCQCAVESSHPLAPLSLWSSAGLALGCRLIPCSAGGDR